LFNREDCGTKRITKETVYSWTKHRTDHRRI